MKKHLSLALTDAPCKKPPAANRRLSLFEFSEFVFFGNDNKFHITI